MGKKKNLKVEKKSQLPKKKAVVQRKKTATAEKKLMPPKKVERSAKQNMQPTPLTQQVTIISPTPRMLSPFRRAAKETKRKQKALERDRKEKRGFLAKHPKDGKQYNIDLRIHSPGSRGYFSLGGVDCGAALVRVAKVKGLDVIAITDYVNASHVDEVRKVGLEENIHVIPGVDLRCRVGDCDEVFLTALFPEEFDGQRLFQVLSDLGVSQDSFGDSRYVLPIEFEEVIDIIEKNGGVVIPTRIDKTPYQQLALPDLIERFGFHAFDVVHPENLEFFRERWPEGQFTFFTFSNANSLAQVGSRSDKVRLAVPGFEGIKQIVQWRG